MAELKGQVFVGLTDTGKDGISFDVFSSESEAVDSLCSQEDLDSFGLSDKQEFIDEAEMGSLGEIYSAKVESRSVDILSIIQAEQREDEAKPYIFTIDNIYGSFSETKRILEWSINPDETLQKLAQEERDGEFDEDAGIYWFDCNATKPISYKEVTSQQAAIFEYAKHL